PRAPPRHRHVDPRDRDGPPRAWGRRAPQRTPFAGAIDAAPHGATGPTRHADEAGEEASPVTAPFAVTVDRVLAARASRIAGPAPSEGHALSLAEAYDVQDSVRQALLARGERVVGWKAGFTSRTTQQAFATDRPACGFLLGSGVYAGGAEVPTSDFIGLVVEAEVALVMGRALAGPGVTPPQALLAVEGAVPALELIDFRYAGKPTAIDAVADGVFARAIVLGAPLTDVTHLDLALEGLVYELNGAVA